MYAVFTAYHLNLIFFYKSFKIVSLLLPNYIEKHFTIDNKLTGRYNNFSILSNKLKRLN